MIITAMGGLCNRLRAWVSRWEPGSKDLVVFWEPNWEVAFGRWEDAFDPVENVTIIDAIPAGETPFIETCFPTGVHWSNWIERMKRLHPNARTQAKIVSLQVKMGSYDAVHIRRTDGSWIAREAGRYTPDSTFEAYVKSTTGYLYLATDNSETVEKVRGWIGDRLVVGSEIAPSAEECGRGIHHRYTSLSDTVVDFYMCLGASRFMGTVESSFSATIAMLRGTYGRATEVHQ